jgi:hypothetical protein
MHNGNCPQCGASFGAKSKRRVYCSTRCQRKTASDKWREVRRDRYLLLHRQGEKRRKARDRERYLELSRKRLALWRSKNPGRNVELARVHKVRVRHEALMAYGGYACACCGITTPEFLSLDHIGGRRASGHPRGLTGTKLYALLRREGWPPGFRVLCHNCNQAIGTYGTCPHKKNTALLALNG